MTHESVALILWSILALDAVLTLVALGTRNWKLMLIAAVMSFAFAVPAILSIGIFILAIALVQLVVAVMLRRSVTTTT